MHALLPAFHVACRCPAFSTTRSLRPQRAIRKEGRQGDAPMPIPTAWPSAHCMPCSAVLCRGTASERGPDCCCNSCRSVRPPLRGTPVPHLPVRLGSAPADTHTEHWRRCRCRCRCMNGSGRRCCPTLRTVRDTWRTPGLRSSCHHCAGQLVIPNPPAIAYCMACLGVVIKPCLHALSTRTRTCTCARTHTNNHH